MRFVTGHAAHGAALVDLFAATFAASEGEAEGRLIGALVADLFATTPPADIHSFSAWTGDTPLGALLFTRMRYPEDARVVYVMAPVAVAPGHQRQGIGQRLIARGLAGMRAAGADVALTYGNPDYYGKSGFVPITEAQVAAPFPLSLPHGWLGQSLTGAPLEAIPGPAHCVPGFDNPAFW